MNSVYQLACWQMAGAGKSRNQDALFNGHEVLQATSVAPQDVPATVPLRLAVADGVFASPGAHLASRYWMHAFTAQGEANARFLRRHHADFCKTLARRYFGAASTFAAVCLDGHGTGEIANVGDSRIYHIDRSRK